MVFSAVNFSVMGSLLLMLLSFYLIVFLSNAVSLEKEEVSITVEVPNQGLVLGGIDQTLWTNQKFYHFKGIPYAESPRGKLRFRPPKPRLPWRQILDARNFGNRCPVITSVAQLSPKALATDIEDCLNLSVYTKNVADKKPVMFYIYGGGFYNGSAIDHPANFLMEKDIVLVVPQYRIGALGWLTNFTPDMPGNAPIADILLALDWVKQKIPAFGGDPEKITIFSQSAGAGVSSSLLLSPKTPKDAFKKLIVQSGSIFATWAVNRDPRSQAQKICRSLQCYACDDDSALSQCLVNVPAVKLLQVTTEDIFAPVVGDLNGILPCSPMELMKSYKRDVPLMTGFTKHDGTFMLATYYDIIKKKVGDFSRLTVRNFANIMMKAQRDDSQLSNSLLTRLMIPYNLLETNDHKQAIPSYFDICSTIFMKSPVITLARTIFENQKSEVYLYSFEYEGNNTRFGYEFGNEQYPFEGGVHHSNDNIYLFNTHELNENDSKMAKKMVDLWTSFAINGKPKSSDDDTQILPMKTSNGPYFHIDSKIRISNDVLQELTATIDDKDNQRFIRGNVPFK